MDWLLYRYVFVATSVLAGLLSAAAYMLPGGDAMEATLIGTFAGACCLASLNLFWYFNREMLKDMGLRY